MLWMLRLLGRGIDELARGLFYTPAQQHWQLVLATSCMAASKVLNFKARTHAF